MGAISAPNPSFTQPIPNTSISDALSANSSGNPLLYHQLQHSLSGKDPNAIAAILTDLTHYATSLHEPSSEHLHELVATALELDFAACAVPTSGDFPALDAFQIFAMNLASAHAGYVEQVFDCIARKVFTLGVDVYAPILKRVHVVIEAICKLYPRAIFVLGDVLVRRYPHAVRATKEHVSYARACLEVARRVRRMRAGVVAMVFERLGAIEAMVGSDVWEVKGESLTLEAGKLEGVMMEVIAYVDSVQDGGVFEDIYDAFESAIVPVDGTRYVGYVVMYAAVKEGMLESLVERLRVGFFDRVSEGLKEKFLRHSSAVVVRARDMTKKHVIEWVAEIAKWLNGYVDRWMRGGGGYVDPSMHASFYCACCVLMSTIVGRKDAFEGNLDLMHSMRLLRVMSSGMNPLLVNPEHIVEEFVTFVEGPGGLDLQELIENNRPRLAMVRTRFNGGGSFMYKVQYVDIELPAVRKKLAEVVRHDDGVSEEGGEDGCVVDAVASDKDSSVMDN